MGSIGAHRPYLFLTRGGWPKDTTNRKWLIFGPFPTKIRFEEVKRRRISRRSVSTWSLGRFPGFWGQNLGLNCLGNFSVKIQEIFPSISGESTLNDTCVADACRVVSDIWLVSGTCHIFDTFLVSDTSRVCTPDWFPHPSRSLWNHFQASFFGDYS